MVMIPSRSALVWLRATIATPRVLGMIWYWSYFQCLLIFICHSSSWQWKTYYVNYGFSLYHELFVLSFDFFFPFHKWLYTICQNTWGWQNLPWCKALSLLRMILQIFDQDSHLGCGTFFFLTRIDIFESWK